MSDPDRSLSPADRIVAAYLVLTLPLLFLVDIPDRERWLMIAVHPAVVLGVFALRRSRFSGTRVGRILLDFYPLVFFGYLYAEVAVLNRAFFPDEYLDRIIIDAEQALFGAQPAMDFRRVAPWPGVAEYLQFCYFSYYLYTPSLALTIYIFHGRRDYHAALGTLALTYLVGFLLFVFVPVGGPYYEFPRMNPNDFGWIMPRIVQTVLNQGSAIGTAFPSSHVSIGTTVWIMAMRYNRPLAVALTFVVPGMALGAVYGGYHYAIDAMAGAVLGILVCTVGHHYVRRAAVALYPS